jgi:hypothetical protein
MLLLVEYSHQPRVLKFYQTFANCTLLLPQSTPTCLKLQKLYRLTKQDLIDAKRILVVNGGYDPITAFGPGEFPVSSDRDATRRLLGYSWAHCEEINSRTVLTDFYGENAIPSTEVRDMMRNITIDWLDVPGMAS